MAFESRTQKVSERWPFESRTVQLSDGNCIPQYSKISLVELIISAWKSKAEILESKKSFKQNVSTYANCEDAYSSGQEANVSDEESDDPNNRQFHVNELKALTRSC
jgi:hypothetical protein